MNLSVGRETLELGLVCEGVMAVANRYREIRWAMLLVVVSITAKMLLDKYLERRRARDIEVAQMMKETIDVLQNNAARYEKEL